MLNNDDSGPILQPEESSKLNMEKHKEGVQRTSFLIVS